MAFVLIGLALLAMKLADIGPGAAWSWWVVLTPFALAVAWWTFADTMGLSQKRAMEKAELRKEERRQKAMDAMGINPKRERQIKEAAREARDAARLKRMDRSQRKTAGEDAHEPNTVEADAPQASKAP